jgi:hypothetical protein
VDIHFKLNICEVRDSDVLVPHLWNKATFATPYKHWCELSSLVTQLRLRDSRASYMHLTRALVALCWIAFLMTFHHLCEACGRGPYCRDGALYLHQKSCKTFQKDLASSLQAYQHCNPRREQSAASGSHVPVRITQCPTRRHGDSEARGHSAQETTAAAMVDMHHSLRTPGPSYANVSHESSNLSVSCWFNPNAMP